MPQDPLDSIFGAIPSSRVGNDPLDDIFGASTDTPSTNEEDNIRRAVAKLRAIKPANEAQRKRIADLIDKYETHGHSVAGNLARGLGAGVVRAIPQMASTLNQLTGQEDPELERIRKINEFFDVGGTAGKVGGFIGEVVGSGPAYGKLVNTTAKGIAAVSPTAGKFISSIAKPGASLARHAAVNVAVGLPINIAQGLGTYEQDIPPDATPEEADAIRSANRKAKLLNVGVGVVADALFGSAAEGASRILGRMAPKGEAAAAATPEGQVPTAAATAEREAALQAAKLKREAREKTTAEKAKVRKLAAAEWTLANPDKNWKNDLTSDERAKYVDEFKMRAERDRAELSGVGPSAAPGAVPGGVSGEISPEVQAVLGASQASREKAAADLTNVANPNLDKTMTEAELQTHADEGFNAAEANRPSVELTPEQQAKQKEYEDVIALEEALATTQERGGLQTEEQWNSFIEDVNLLKKKGLPDDQMRVEIQNLIDDYTPPEIAGVPSSEPKPPPDAAIKELNDLSQHLTGENDPPEVLARAQKLYESLRNDHGLSDEQIAEMQARHVEGNDTLSMMRTGDQTVGAGFDKSLFKKLGANLYKGNLKTIALKEGIQNAFDAVRPMLNRGHPANVDILYEPTRHTFTFEDNGVGMAPEVVEKEFVDVGGSFKNAAEGASGGYGLAKVGLFSQAQNIELESVADTPNGRVLTTLTGSGEDWVDGNMRIATEPTDRETGSRLAITLSPDIPEDWSMRAFAGSVARYNRLPINLTIRELRKNWSSGREQLDNLAEQVSMSGQPLPKLEFEDTPFIEPIRGGEMEINLGKEQTRGPTNVAILNNGLYQFNDVFWDMGSGDHPAEIVVDVKSNVGVDDPAYPFTTSREELKGEAAKRLQSFMTNLQMEVGKREVNKLMDALDGAPKIPGTELRVYPTDPAVPKELAKEVAESKYTRPIAVAFQRTVKRAYSIAKHRYPHIVAPEFTGFGLSDGWLGVNISRDAIRRFAQDKGIDVTGMPDENMILYNPFTSFLELTKQMQFWHVQRADFYAEDLADQAVGTAIHEVAHQLSRGHNEEFAGVITRMLARGMRKDTESFGELYLAWKDALELEDTFVTHAERLRDTWSKNVNIFKNFSGHQTVEGAGGHLEDRSPAGEYVQPRVGSSEGTPEGGTAQPEGNLRGAPTEPGAVRPEPSAVRGAGESAGSDPERTALIAELVATPIFKRGPILAKLKELNTRRLTEAAGKPAPETISPNTPASPTLEPAPLPTPEGTYLESVAIKTPIEQMTDEQLGRLDDKIAEMIENKDVPDAIQEVAVRDLNKIADFRIANARPREQTVVDVNANDLNPATFGAARTERIVAPIEEPSADEAARKALRTKMMRGMRKLSDEEVKTAIADLETESRQIEIEIQTTSDKAAALRAALATASEADAKQLAKQAQRLDLSTTELRERLTETKQALDKVFGERAERFLSTGLRAQIPPTVGGGMAGFVGGLFVPADNEEERMNHAWMGLAAGMAVGAGLGRYNKMVKGRPENVRTVAELPGGAWQAEMAKSVITGNPKAERDMSFIERMRHIYWSTARRSYVGERLTESVRANSLSTARNPGKIMSMFGRWSAMTESALRDGPSIVDDFGTPKHLGAPGVHEILLDVNGDVESLGILAAARSKVELGDAIKTPFDTIVAENVYRAMPEAMHKAADKLRQLSLGMADVAVWGGMLSQAGRDKFAQETMYAPFMRIFKFDTIAGTISTESVQNKIVGAANPIKARKGGSKASIKNPAESVFEAIPRIFRAAELNRIKESFLTAWEAAGKPDIGIRRLSKGELGDTSSHDALVATVKAELGLADPDANALVAALDPNSIDVERGTMKIYREGSVQSYQIPPELAHTILSLTPDEMSLLTKMAGLPARTAAAGIVYNPFFIAKMGFFDAFQATANSAYGFRFGWDNIRGYLNIVTRSKKYQDLLATGLSHQALAGGNLENIKTTVEALRRTAGTPIEVSIRHLKEGRPIEFYKALIAPIADAARVGEALRALDHGASHLDAVYAAKNVVGNYAEIGAWHGMRGLQHQTMFLGPAIQVLDTALYRSGLHPFRSSGGLANRAKDFGRYFWKMGSLIAIPSWYFWMKAESENDEEIRQMRTSDYGRRFWFYRLNWDVPGFGKQGEVVRIPKPILDGQLFGTSVELALDKMKGTDQAGIDELVKGAGRDAAFNLLPSIGVIPTALAFNKDPSTGWNIEPEGQQDITPEHRGEANASWLSRNISHSLAPKFEGVNWPLLQRSLSPAGIDYLFNSVGGMLGRDAVTAVSAALEYEDTGYIPAKQEWPIVRQVFVQVPSRQTHDIQEFYRQADRVEQVSRTIAHMMKEDPARLLEYMERHQSEYQVAAAYAKARSQIAGYRRAIADLRELPTDLVSSEDRRKMVGEYVKYMNQTAAEVNDVTRQWLK